MKDVLKIKINLINLLWN